MVALPFSRYFDMAETLVWPDDPEERGTQKCWFAVQIRSVLIHGEPWHMHRRRNSLLSHASHVVFGPVFIAIVSTIGPSAVFMSLSGTAAAAVTIWGVVGVRYGMKLLRLSNGLYREGERELRQAGVEPPPKRTSRANADEIADRNWMQHGVSR